MGEHRSLAPRNPRPRAQPRPRDRGRDHHRRRRHRSDLHRSERNGELGRNCTRSLTQAPTGRMKLYVYCLAEGVPRLHETSHGISGEPVRIVEFEDFSAVVSVSRSEAFQITRKNALAHHEVVRSITQETTPLPTRFGTLVTVEQLRNYVSAHHQAIKAKLAQVRGGVEMN